MNNEECIARIQQLSEEMFDLVRDLALSDQYQNALDDENRRLIEENRELKKELGILRAKSGRTQDFRSTKNTNGLKRPKRIEHDEIDAIIHPLLDQDGNLTHRKIAAMPEILYTETVLYQSVKRWRELHGLDTPEQIELEPEETGDRKSLVIRLYNEDIRRSDSDIAVLSGVPNTTVWRYLKPYRDKAKEEEPQDEASAD